ncbi:retrovirus-related pol polyprotein from transposon TNT 1-94 [Tanacetum coccineum]
MSICYNCKGEGHISKQCTMPKRKRDETWFNDKVLLVQAQASGQVLTEEEIAFLADPGLPDTQTSSTVHYPQCCLSSQMIWMALMTLIVMNLLSQFLGSNEQYAEIVRLKQTLSEQVQRKGSLMKTVSDLKKDLKMEENRNIDREIALEKKLSNLIISFSKEKVRESKPKLYDGNVILKMDTIVIPDSDETLMLCEESRSKMLLKEQDPMVVKNKVNTKPINYAVLNNDYNKRFVRQSDLYSEHAYWKATSVPPLDHFLLHNINKVEVPKEFPKEKNSVIDPNARLSFTQLFELSELRAQSQEKDTVIVKLKEKIKSLKGNVDDSKVKMDMDKIETLNIELEHRVTKLVAENEHLKQTYKQLYDLIKPKCVQSKEQSDALIKQVNIKSGKIFDLNAKLSEHRFGPEQKTLKNGKGNLRKPLDKEAIRPHLFDPKVSKDNVEPITPKLLNKRTAHSSYIKHTQEEALVLRDIVEHVKANYPQDSLLESAFRNGTVKVNGSASVQNSKKHDNSDYVCINGDDCMSSDNLITTTNEVPSRKPIVLESESPKPVVNLVYSRKPRKNKNTESLSKTELSKLSLVVDSGCRAHDRRSPLSSQFHQLNSWKWGIVEMIQVWLKEIVCHIRTDNGTEFVNHTLREYYEKVDISHETSVARSPQQNGVVERRNRTIIKAARIMKRFMLAQPDGFVDPKHKPKLRSVHLSGSTMFFYRVRQELYGTNICQMDIIFAYSTPELLGLINYLEKPCLAEEEVHPLPDWFQQPKRLPSPDHAWNKSVPAVHESVQPWLSNLARRQDPRESFDELTDTTFDFSAFVMNRLNVTTLTPELLAGPTFELMKGTCKSLTELEYFCEEVYKATTEKLDWINPEGRQYPHDLRKPLPLVPNSQGRHVIPFHHFINNDLEYLRGGESSRKYSTSVTKTKAADYGHIKWIEDLVPNSMWSQVIVNYDKFALWGISHWGKKRRQFYAFATTRESARDVYSKRRIIAVTKVEIVEWQNYKHLDWITVRRDDDILYKFKEGDFHRLRIQDIEDMLLLLVQGKLTNLNVEERLAFNVSLRMFTRSVVIQRRVEDLQLGVESYQKKLNLTKPDTYRSNLRRRDAYTPYSDPRGFIYENKDKKNRLMRIDELHKFSDGTLDDVRTALNDRLKGIRMEYLPQTFWSQRDKANARAMIQAIDKRLKTRRIMRSLERFVGGRPYGGDLRLLQRTI